MFSALKKSLRIESKVEAPKADISNHDPKEKGVGDAEIEDIIVVKDLDATRKEEEIRKVEEVRENNIFVVKDLDTRLEEEDVEKEQNMRVEEELEDVKKETGDMKEGSVDDVGREDIKLEVEDIKKEIQEEPLTSTSTSTSISTLTPKSSNDNDIGIPSPPSSEIGEDIIEESEGEQAPIALAASAIIPTPGNDRCLVGSPPAITANPDLEVNKNEETSTSTTPRHSRAISPTPIENHCHTQNQEKRFSSSTTDFEINAPNTPPATPPRVVRRERSATQREREILRSRQFSEKEKKISA